MKKIFVSFLLCLFTMTASAQIVKNLEYPKAHFGIRTAFTNNSVSVSDGNYGQFGSLPFVSGGLALDFRIASIPLYLETGLYYMNNGYKYSYDYNNYEETINNHSVKMPLLMSYHLYFTDNMAIQPFVGPYVGFGIDEERVDYGIRAGLGWNFGRLSVNAGYDFGFEVDGYKNNTVFATIGFNFAGSY